MWWLKMPKFKNNTNRDICFLHQGRKIKIPPNVIVDGPEYFKMYKGLEVVTNEEVDRYHKILPKTVQYDRSSNIKKFIKPNESIMSSTDISAIPYSAVGIDSVFNSIRYLTNYPRNGIKVTVLLNGLKDEVKSFILLSALSSAIKNVEYIWVNDTVDGEIKTVKEDDISKIDSTFVIRHSATLPIIDDYILTFVKIGCVNKVVLPKVVELEQLSKSYVKQFLIENYLEKRNCDISIVTLTNNINQYSDFLEDLKKQKSRLSYEIITVPNFNKEFTSCAEALNLGRELSSGKIVVMCHQDLRVPEGWLHGIYSHVGFFEDRKIKWGVLGMAGCYKNSLNSTPDQDLCIIYLSDRLQDGRSYAQAYRQMFGPRKEVQTIDELCLIVPKDAPFKFDESILDHFHWYGADICLDAMSKGYRNFAIDAECVHLSDGRSNLSGNNSTKFIEDAKKIWWKWGSRYNYFRTTTATFLFKERVIIFGIFILINNSSGNKNLPEMIRMD
jgi:hypothetical protein